MGWGSSADYHAPTRIDFSSRADAIHFAEKQGPCDRTRGRAERAGIPYFVQEPHAPKFKPKSVRLCGCCLSLTHAVCGQVRVDGLRPR